MPKISPKISIWTYDRLSIQRWVWQRTKTMLLLSVNLSEQPCWHNIMVRLSTVDERIRKNWSSDCMLPTRQVNKFVLFFHYIREEKKLGNQNELVIGKIEDDNTFLTNFVYPKLVIERCLIRNIKSGKNSEKNDFRLRLLNESTSKVLCVSSISATKETITSWSEIASVDINIVESRNLMRSFLILWKAKRKTTNNSLKRILERTKSRNRSEISLYF